MLLYHVYKYIEYTTEIVSTKFIDLYQMYNSRFQTCHFSINTLVYIGNGSNQKPKKIEAQVKITQYRYDTFHFRHKNKKMKKKKKKKMVLITNFCKLLFNFWKWVKFNFSKAN